MVRITTPTSDMSVCRVFIGSSLQHMQGVKESPVSIIPIIIFLISYHRVNIKRIFSIQRAPSPLLGKCTIALSLFSGRLTPLCIIIHGTDQEPRHWSRLHNFLIRTSNWILCFFFSNALMYLTFHMKHIFFFFYKLGAIERATKL